MENEENNTGSEERKMFKAVCTDCGTDCEVPFEPTEGKPVRCRDCFMKSRPRRNNFGGGNRNNFNRGPREMHKATCDECKKDCEVPFKPTQGKPVLCMDCFKKKKGF